MEVKRMYDPVITFMAVSGIVIGIAVLGLSYWPKRQYDEECIFSGHEWDECTYYGEDHSCPCEKMVTVNNGKFVQKRRVN